MLGPGFKPIVNFISLFREWHFSLPRKTNWMVFIDRLNFANSPVNTQSFLTNVYGSLTPRPEDNEELTVTRRAAVGMNLPFYEDTHGNSRLNQFVINQYVRLLTSKDMQQTYGCLFVDGVDIPVEQMSVSIASVPNRRGFIPGIISGERQGYNTALLQMRLREHNISFADFIIKPWTIMAAHKGLVAREGDDSITTNITVIEFTPGPGRGSQPPTIRRVYKFFECIPIIVNGFSLAYDPRAEALESRNVSWTYNHYTVEGPEQFQGTQFNNELALNNLPNQPNLGEQISSATGPTFTV